MGSGGVLHTSRTSAVQQLEQKGAFSCVPPPASLMSGVWASFRGVFSFLHSGSGCVHWHTRTQTSRNVRSQQSHADNAEQRQQTGANWLNWLSCWTETWSIRMSNKRLVPSFLIFVAVSSPGVGDDTLRHHEKQPLQQHRLLPKHDGAPWTPRKKQDLLEHLKWAG